MQRSSARMRARVVSRRDVLAGGAALAGVALAGCETPEKTGAPSLVEDGTIPAITPNADFYITSCCGTPEVDGARWALVVRRGGEELGRIDLAAFEAMALRDKEHTLECISANPYNLAISNAVWTGLPLRELFDALGVAVPGAAIELKFTSADDYTTSVPVGDLDRIWLVTRMNGEPLPPEHGYPARLLVPGRYGMKNPKWLLEIELVDQAYTGFWEQRGWSNEATYRPNALAHQPSRFDAVVEAGAVRVLGTAFAGDDPVVRVEASVDGGAWAEVAIDYAPGADIWTLWHLDLDLPVGTHVLRLRCTTASGATTGADPEGSDPLGGYDGGMEMEIEAV